MRWAVEREIADRIRERGGDYVLAVKQNQPKLYERVEEAINEALERDAENLDEHQTVEKGHGRQETRTYLIVAAPDAVDPEELWRRPQRRRYRDLGAGGLPGTREHGDPLLHPNEALPQTDESCKMKFVIAVSSDLWRRRHQ